MKKILFVLFLLPGIFSATLASPPPCSVSATVNYTNITCHGAGDGTISITSPTGGSGTYQYSINGGSSWTTNSSFTGLTVSTHNVQIRDKNNTSCLTILNAALSITQPALLNATVTVTNVTCYGNSDGTITFSSPSGGYGTYNYSINGGSTWQSGASFTSLAPNTYDVQIQDAAHTLCVVDLGTKTIIQPSAALSATVISVNVSCHGAGDGSITVTPSGGYGTYQYSMNGGSTWLNNGGSFTGLGPSTHDIWIRDKANTGCTYDYSAINGNVGITQPAVLNATVTSTNVTCFGNTDGTITISNPSGGYGTYNYSINGGSVWGTSGSFTGLAPNTYDVQIQDAANTACIIDLGTKTIQAPPAALSATVSFTNISCRGAVDGSITITPSGGYGTYQYSINGGTNWLNNGGNFTGLAVSTHDVQIRDKANPNCVYDYGAQYGNISITQPAVLNATVTSTNVTCFGNTDGTITISNESGGASGTYEISIDGGSTWSSDLRYTGLSGGSYDVWIEDAADPACSVDLGTQTIASPTGPLGATVNSTNVTCLGAADGTITISNPTGGYGTYQYTINGGTSWLNNGGSFSNLAYGTYNVQIRDKANPGCWVVLNGSLYLSRPSKLSAAVNSTNVTCYGNSDGTITISNESGGASGTYETSIDGGVTYSSTLSYTGLSSGSYDVWIEDAADPACSVDLGTKTIQAPPAALSATVSFTNISCRGAADGSITITPSGGYGTYQYSINGGTNWLNNGGDFTGLAVSTYDVQIRDKANTTCVYDYGAQFGNISITQPAVLNATVTSTNVTCFGNTDGTITISNESGGASGTYETSIDGGVTYSSNLSYIGLTSGSYDVWIEDAADPACSIDLGTQTIASPDALSATVSSTNVTCFDAADGTITVTPSGGWGTWQYSKDGGTTWLNNKGLFKGLIHGIYDIWIRDKANINCVYVYGNVTITRPPLLKATVSPTNVSCNGLNDGIITITSPSGGPSSIPTGTGSYLYSDDGGNNYYANGGVFSNLGPGTFDIWIQDATDLACTVDLGVQTISQPDAYYFYVDNDGDGYGTGNLVAVCATDANTPPPGYSLNNSDCDDNDPNVWQSGLLYIDQDGDGYDAGQTTVCYGNTAPSGYSFTTLGPDCNDNDPTVWQSGLLYIDNDGDGYDAGQTTVCYGNSAPSGYSLTTNGPDCNDNDTNVWLSSDAPTGNSSQSFCAISNSTVADISVAGDNIIWYDASSAGNVVSGTTPLANGKTYYASQTVANGCESTVRFAVSITIGNQSPPSGDANQSFCASNSPLVSNISVTGTAITWYDNSTAGNVVAGSTALTDGTTYYASQTVGGCESTDRLAVTVTLTTQAAPSTGTITQPTCSTATGTVDLSGLPSGNWTITPSSGSAVNGSGSTYSFSGLSASTSYTFTVTNASGCISAASGNVSINSQPTTPSLSTGTLTNPTSCGDDGSIVLNFTNVPNGSYTISYSSGSFSNVTVSDGTAIISAKAGTYSDLEITANGCPSAAGVNASLTDPSAPSAPVVGTITQPTCSNATGRVDLSGLPVSGSWTVTESIGATTITGTGATGSFGNLASDTYTFTVTNSAGCTSGLSGNALINTAPSTPAAPTSSLTQPTCALATGTVNVTTPHSGTGISYTLTGTNPVVSAVSNPTGIFSGLNSGIYNLTTTNSAGCTSNSASLTINPQPSPPAVNAITGTSTVNAGSTTTLHDSTNGGVWSSSNSAIASVNNSTGVVTGVSAGSVTISYTVTTGGCTNSASTSVTVSGSSSLYNVTGGGSYCAGGSGIPIGLSGSKRGSLYQLKLNGHNIGNVVIGTGSAISFGLETAAGTYTVAVITVFPPTSTLMTGNAVISIIPLPSAPGPITGTTAICAGKTTTLHETTIGGVWSSSNNVIAKISNTGVVTGLVSGSVTIRYTVTNGNGCSNWAGTTVTVNASPGEPGNFIISSSSVNQGQRNVPYVVPAMSNVSYDWNYSGIGAAISGIMNSVLVSYSNSATSGILSVSTANGCGISIPRSMSITVRKNGLKSDSIPSIISSGSSDIPALENVLKAYPNPTLGPANFEFQIGETSRLTLDIFSIAGKHIARIYDANLAAGIPQTVYFGQVLPPGIYIGVMRWKSQILTVKLVVTQ